MGTELHANERECGSNKSDKQKSTQELQRTANRVFENEGLSFIADKFVVVCRKCGVVNHDKVRIELTIEHKQLNKMIYETRPVLTIVCDNCQEVATNGRL